MSAITDKALSAPLIAYAYAAAAEVVLFIRDRALFSRARLLRDSVIASLAFAYSVWAIWGSGEEWLAKGFMLLLFGIPVFVWMRWRRSRQPLHVPAEWTQAEDGELVNIN